MTLPYVIEALGEHAKGVYLALGYEKPEAERHLDQLARLSELAGREKNALLFRRASKAYGQDDSVREQALLEAGNVLAEMGDYFPKGFPVNVLRYCSKTQSLIAPSLE